MNKLAIIIMCLIFTSCVTQKKCNEKFPSTASIDSIRIETVKEIPVYLPGDSILIDVPADCSDIEPVIFENGKLKQTISILSGKLTSLTNIKPDTLYVPVTEVKTVVKEVKVPEKVKYVPNIIKVFSWVGISAAIGIFIFLFIKIKKIL